MLKGHHFDAPELLFCIELFLPVVRVEGAFPFFQRNKFCLCLFDPYEAAVSDQVDGRSDLFLRALYFHRDGTVVFVSDPAGQSQGLSSHHRLKAEADTLYLTIEMKMSAYFIHDFFLCFFDRLIL